MLFARRGVHGGLLLATCIVLLALGTSSVRGARAALSRSRPWTPGSYPNPTKDTRACGRPSVSLSWICDPDDVIGEESANVVEGLLKKIRAGEAPFIKAPCGSGDLQGYEVAVALMREFQLAPGESAEEGARAFAKRLHEDWRVGSAECENGVLLLLSVHNRQLYISTGVGAAEVLTYDSLGEVIDAVKPLLRKKRYCAGVEQAVLDVGLLLAGQPLPNKHHGDGDRDDDEWSGDGSLFWVFGSVVAAMFGWSWWNTRKQRARFQSCKDKLQKLKRDQQLARTHAYEFTTCPVCLEDLEQPPSQQQSTVSTPTDLSTNAEVSSSGGSKADAGHPELEPLVMAAAKQPGSGSIGDSRAKKLMPIVLPCGHAFCEPCIAKWLKTKVTCPICRKPVDQEDDDDSSRGPPPPCSTAYGDDGATTSSGMRTTTYGDTYSAVLARQEEAARRRRAGLGTDLLLAELAFRVRSLQHQYPDVVSNQLAQQMEADVAQGVDLSAALQSVQLSNPAARANLGHSGSTGASMSFGGGGGGGGGGRGGGW